MGLMGKRVSKLDLFRSLPLDLTEATALGGWVSILAVLALLALFVGKERGKAARGGLRGRGECDRRAGC